MIKRTVRGVKYFPRGIFPSENFQMAISRLCNFPRDNFPKVRLGLLRCSRLQWGSRAAAKMGQGPSTEVRTGQGPSAVTKTCLGSHRIGNCTAGKFPLGKLPIGSCHLGKSHWESTQLPDRGYISLFTISIFGLFCYLK